MASSLSEEEFVRMQTQLLELRTTNYSLDDQCKRQERELLGLRDHVDRLDKELQKANKIVNKSKKAKEFDLLLTENESFQRKLQSQEEDFRLQNETLMQELAQVITVNENLEKENQTYKDGGASEWKTESQAAGLQDEVRHLQAQNSALQKNLTSGQDKYETELNCLRQTVHDLEAQCLKLAGQRGSPVGQGSSERTVEGHSDTDALREDTIDGTDDTTDEVENGNTQLLNVVNRTDSSHHRLLEDTSKELNDLRISLDTEKEEKRILKEQFQAVEKSYREQVKGLEDELDKLSDKYKKKQESLVQLQEEKEKIFSDLSGKVSAVESQKNEEIQQLSDKCSRLQDDLVRATQVLEDYKHKADNRVRELEDLVLHLEGKVESAGAETREELQAQISHSHHQGVLLQQQLDQLTQERDDLSLQLQESQKANTVTLEQLYDAQQERDRQIQALQESSKVAEKRKALLDELAIKYQTENEQHREQMRLAQEKHETYEEELRTQIKQLQKRTSVLEAMQAECEELKASVMSLENTKGWLERRLTETEENLAAFKQQSEQEAEEMRQQHKQATEEQQQQQQQQLQEFEERLAGVQQEKVELEQVVTNLQQEIKDGIDAKKIHEKKGATMLKDLKRQLQAERKRAEKLQERLQEVLSDAKNRTSMEELFRPVDPNDSFRGDTSSISSWSTSGLGRDSNAPMSPESDAQSAILEQETSELVGRLAQQQKDNWTLEEKVAHLEASNAAMAEDILRKTAIIEHYIMDRNDRVGSSPAQEKLTLKRVMDFVKDKGDENMREINRKLQRMLEETLTKNMHLQQDLETMSQEVVRLSKSASNTPTGSPAKVPNVAT